MELNLCINQKPSLNSEEKLHENYSPKLVCDLIQSTSPWYSSFYKVILFNLMNMQNYVGNCTPIKEQQSERVNKAGLSRAKS
jgi:hypothetical protein